MRSTGFGSLLTLGSRRKSLGSRSYLLVQDDDGDARQMPQRVSVGDLVEYVADSIDLPAAVAGPASTSVVAGAWVASIVTLTGTSATLLYDPIAPEEALVILESANIVLGWAASAPGTNKFTISGDTLSVNAARADSVLKVYYRIASTAMHAELPAGLGPYPTNQVELEYTPSNPNLATIVWVPANIPLRYTTGVPTANEYSVAGKVLTFERTMTADGQVLAHYPIG